MQWVNALSTKPSLEAALQDVVTQAKARLVDRPQAVMVGAGAADPNESAPAFDGSSARVKTDADLAILFISSAFASEYARVLPLLQDLLSVKVLVGCSGGGIVGGDREVEANPAIALSLAVLPEVNLYPFHINGDDLPDLDASPAAWEKVLQVPQESHPHFVVLADSFSSRINDLLQGLDFTYPSATKVGGLASGGNNPEQNALFLNDTLHRFGTVGVALSGNIAIDSLVAQGCRPIGDPLRVTKAERNVAIALDDRPPLEVLQDVVRELSPEDRELARTSLFVGLVMDEFKSKTERGDFLIRNILGLDPNSGAIAIGDRIRPGQTIQFHLRDARTSEDDLRWVLSRYRDRLDGDVVGTVSGAVMFSCLGRGEHLYSRSNVDSSIFSELAGTIPLGGFFCNGEIGPVGGTTFLHGYTSVFGLFRPVKSTP
ncbi:MAG: FIST N-terminal domain-containing protein [Cyanobacteria bacterium P01_F01_bin.33]